MIWGLVVRLSAVCGPSGTACEQEKPENCEIREAINNNPATETTLLFIRHTPGSGCDWTEEVCNPEPRLRGESREGKKFA